MLYSGYLITFGIAAFQNLVSARFCEGGHRCSPPKECCAQGCCYLYAPPSAPRSTPPSTDHVLNLFFINHWYFWCVILALILAILCACSLWKKRRQLCGWGSPRPHSQSGDSTGSCYAPPQYSRCSSFHHAPPPYTEVTSKPDLYPLVFTCNGDNTKNGSSYLMVQYFRNYIVRPVGSLSATSTVDSLSSSFICTANEANTLVPPPYSRAASPDLPLTITASSTTATSQAHNIHNNNNYHQLGLMQRSASQQGCSMEHHLYRPVPIFSRDDLLNTPTESCSSNNNSTNNNININSNNNNNSNNNHHAMTMMRMSESCNFQTIYLNNNQNNSSDHQSQFRHNIVNSKSINNISSSPSPLFTTNPHHAHYNNRSSECVGGTDGDGASATSMLNNNARQHKNATKIHQYKSSNAIYNLSDSIENRLSPSQHQSSASNSIMTTTKAINNSNAAIDTKKDYKDLNNLRRSLETCCQMLQQPQHKHQQSFVSNSDTGSAVSSLANIGSPDSPPQATSPTCEIKEILEHIRQLQIDNSSEDINDDEHITKPLTGENSMISTKTTNEKPAASTSSSSGGKSVRPSTLQNRKDSFLKSTKARYFPISNLNTKSLRSPIGFGGGSGNGLLSGRGRKGWISRSAPTTPGTALPSSCFLDDDSPLLNEQDEEDVEHT